MAFFGITDLGYQNILKENAGKKVDPTIRPSILPEDQTSGYGPGHKDSYTEWHRLRTKHTRSPMGPTDAYRSPVLTSQEISWWVKEDSKDIAWTKQPRFIHIDSEMTRFVKKMAQTNKTFSLF